MRQILLIITLLIIVPNAIADEIIFDGWVNDKSTILIDSEPYYATISSDDLKLSAISQVLLIPIDSSQRINGLILTNTACEFVTDTLTYRCYLSVRAHTPNISLLLIPDTSSLFTGDTVQFTLLIENKGQQNVDNATVSLSVPPEFVYVSGDSEIIDHSGRLTWTGKVKRQTEQKIRFKVKGIRRFQGTLQAQLTYESMNLTEDVYSQPIHIEIYPTIRISTDFSSTKIPINSPTDIRIKLNNTANDPVDIDSINILYPSTLKVKSTESIFSQMPEHIQSSSFRLNRVRSFRMKATCTHAGAQSIQIQVRYTKDRQSFTEQQTLHIQCIMRDLVIFSTLNQHTSLTSQQPLLLGISLQNPSMYTNITDVNADITSQITGNRDFHIATLNPVTSHRLVWSNITIPKTNTTIHDTLKIDVIYHIPSGQKFNISKKISYSISPDSPIQLLQTMPNTIKDSDTATLKVQAKNPNPWPTLISASINIPKPLVLTKGHTNVTTVIDAQNTYDILLIKFRPPLVTEKTTYTLTSIITYKTPDNTTKISNLTRDIIVKPQTDYLTVSTTTETHTSVNSIITLTPTIRNTGNRPVYNITLKLLPDESFDITTESYNLTILNPDEQRTIANTFFIRPKTGGKHTYKGFNVTYTIGMKQSFTSKSIQYNIDPTPPLGPLPILTLNHNSSEIFLTIHNIGTDTVIGTFNHTFFTNNIILPPSSTIAFHKNITLPPSNHSIPPAILHYSYLGTDYTAYSNSDRVLIQPKNINTTENITPTKVSEKVPKPSVTEVIHQPTPSNHTSIREKLIIIIKNILTWRLRKQ